MLRLTNVTKRFGSLVAVQDLSLEIQPGEIFGLLGPNGAGKTTTVSMCAGLFSPDSGQVELLGLGSPDRREVRGKIGVAPQALALYEELSGEENLRFFGKIQGLSQDLLSQRVTEMLQFSGLENRKKDRVKTYSGGMKRRLNLAVSLMHNPQLIILDEPTAGVDPQSRNALFDNIEILQKQGRTIIYTTHYMEEAQRLCHRVGIIDHGQLLALGTVDELIEEHGGKSTIWAETENGAVRMETADPLTDLAKLQNQGTLRKLKVDAPDLEGVFLNLTGRKLRD